MRSKAKPIRAAGFRRRIFRSCIWSFQRPSRVRHRELGSADVQGKHRHAGELRRKSGRVSSPAVARLQCTKEPSSEAKWFKQAGGHPPIALTDFMLNTFSAPKFSGFPRRIRQRHRRRHAGRPERQPRSDAGQVHGGTAESYAPTGMPGAVARRRRLPDGGRSGAAVRISSIPSRSLPAGAGQTSRLQPRTVPGRAVDGRLPDERARGTDLHRRFAEPGRSARHLHDQQHPSTRWNRSSSADHRVAPGLRRQRWAVRRRQLPDQPQHLRHPADGGTPRRPADGTRQLRDEKLHHPIRRRRLRQSAVRTVARRQRRQPDGLA